jgi:hypothetical protein
MICCRSPDHPATVNPDAGKTNKELLLARIRRRKSVGRARFVEVSFCEATEHEEHVGELDQPIDKTAQRRPGGRGEVGVDGGRGDAGVAEQDLHDADIDAVLDQSCRVTIPERMRRRPLPDACYGGSGGKPAR